jgi:hypothetical protein
MMILYVFLFLVLLMARAFVSRRASKLESKFERIARAARELLTTPVRNQGNNSKLDVSAYAKQQYLLGQLVEKRDKTEARYLAWQARSEKLGRMLTSLRRWKGRVLPYAAGVVDLAMVLSILTLLGVVEFPALSEAIEQLMARIGG